MVNSNAVSGSTAAGRGFLNRNAIKYILVVLMLLDHTCFVFQAQLPAAVYAVVHTLSRVVAPTMAFFVAEGFLHTSDRTKYRRRMGIFALISWLPCVALFISREELAATPFIVIFHSILSSFYLALVALSVWESEKFKNGFESFVRVACMVKNFRKLRIGQIGLRPGPFYSVIWNEGELLEQFGIKMIPINLEMVRKRMNAVLEENPPEVDEVEKQWEHKERSEKKKKKKEVLHLSSDNRLSALPFSSHKNQ